MPQNCCQFKYANRLFILDLLNESRQKAEELIVELYLKYGFPTFILFLFQILFLSI